MELIGSKKFDELDPDWRCYEIWEPAQRRFLISEVYTNGHWEFFLLVMKSLIIEYLSSSLVARKALEQIDGIGIGFVNEELYFINRENFRTPKWMGCPVF